MVSAVSDSTHRFTFTSTPHPSEDGQISPRHTIVDEEATIASTTLPAKPIQTAEIVHDADNPLVSRRFTRTGSMASPSTRQILKDFGLMTSRKNVRQEALERIRSRSNSEKREREALSSMLDELRRKEESTTRRPHIWKFLNSVLGPSRHIFSDERELERLALHHFPFRGDVKVHICDFMPNEVQHIETTIRDIQKYIVEKPPGVNVRWIHVPIGRGILHSSIQDLFIDAGNCGRRFERAANQGWPYLQIDTVTLTSRDQFQEKRDTYCLLSDNSMLKANLSKRDLCTVTDQLQKDLIWRADHLGIDLNYWEMATSEMSWQLSEGVTLGSQGPMEGIRHVSRKIGRQTLSYHPQFRNAQLIRNPLECYHRDDGLIITFCAPGGVDYLDRNFKTYLDCSPQLRVHHDDSSAFAHIRQAFIGCGTSKWSRPTVEWFLVYLITELGVTPHNIRQGRAASSVLSAYQNVVQELKRRRDEPWRRNETVKLVKDYLKCIDEITALKTVAAEKVTIFEGLAEDCDRFEREDLEAGRLTKADAESPQERAVWAASLLKENRDDATKLLQELQTSLNELFQLRSIEQNELAILTDSQNKAILAFAVVTVVFLPMSFFSSYYGMNLKGLANTDKTEAYFWKVCGSINFGIVLLVSGFAFRDTITRRIKEQRALWKDPLGSI